MTIEPQRVETKPPRINITEALQHLRIGDTIRFPAGYNYGSIRTLATVSEIRISMRMLDSGEIEVTRRPDKKLSTPAKPSKAEAGEKMYDL